MQIYVVTSGEYSDYRINSIFSTAEKAQEYINMKEFTDRYESYRINIWEVDKDYKTDIVDLVLLNNEIYNYDYLKWQIDWLYDEFNNCAERVIEITTDYINNYFTENGMVFHEDDIMFDDEKIKFPIYIVKGVIYNPNKDVMKKVVYDSIAKYKAEKEDI